jgi:phytoene dehydrogenase-like protein
MAKVNFALSALPRFTGIDNQQHLAGQIHIGAHLDDLERAFDAVKYGEMSARPWLDVQIPSILDASLAPPGMHVASVYVHNAPHTLRHGAWTTERDELLKRTLAVLDGYAPRIAELVLSAHRRDAIGPGDVARHLPVVTSFTVSSHPISSSPFVRRWAWEGIGHRSEGCTSAGPEHIPAASSPAPADGLPPWPRCGPATTFAAS